MLILHAAQIKGSLVLWAEDSAPRPDPPGHHAPGEHPCCALGPLLAEAAGLDTDDNRFASAIAWLPSRGDAPVPSSAMAGPMPKIPGQAAHQAVDNNGTPAVPGAGRPTAADLPRAAGAENRRRHRP